MDRQKYVEEIWKIQTTHTPLQIHWIWVPQGRSLESVVYLFTATLPCLEATAPGCCKIKRDVRDLNKRSPSVPAAPCSYEGRRNWGHTMAYQRLHECLFPKDAQINVVQYAFYVRKLQTHDLICFHLIPVLQSDTFKLLAFAFFLFLIWLLDKSILFIVVKAIT